MNAVRYIAVLLVATGVLGQASPKKIVAGFGAFPLSPQLTSLWLDGSDHHPLVLVYFYGPAGWHSGTNWKTNSHFGKDGPGWAELTSDNAELRVWLDPESGRAEVQRDTVDIGQANVFLVLDVTDKSKQRVVALGLAELPSSAGKPASVLLLENNNAIAEKLRNLVAESK